MLSSTAAPATLSSYSSSASPTASAYSNTTATVWTELQCDWIESTTDSQNNGYRKQNDVYHIIVLYVIVCCFGCFANALVLFVFCRSPTLRNVRNWFIFNLACSDLLLCSFTAPATAYQYIMLFWPYGHLACKILASLQALNTFVSSLTLAVIALDRVLLTLSPMHWRLASTAPLLCYLSIWLLSILVALPYALAVSAQPIDVEPWNIPAIQAMLDACDASRPVVCAELNLSWKWSYTLTVLAIQYILPLVSLAFAYTQIGSTIRRRGKTSTTIDASRRSCMQQKNRNAMLLLMALVFNYAFFWAPVNIYNLLATLDILIYSQKVFLMCHLCGIASACMNPILYGLVNESFQTALVELMCRRKARTRHGTYLAAINSKAAPVRPSPTPLNSTLGPSPSIPRSENTHSLLTTL